MTARLKSCVPEHTWQFPLSREETNANGGKFESLKIFKNSCFVQIEKFLCRSSLGDVNIHMRKEKIFVMGTLNIIYLVFYTIKLSTIIIIIIIIITCIITRLLLLVLMYITPHQLQLKLAIDLPSNGLDSLIWIEC